MNVEDYTEIGEYKIQAALNLSMLIERVLRTLWILFGDQLSANDVDRVASTSNSLSRNIKELAA